MWKGYRWGISEYQRSDIGKQEKDEGFNAEYAESTEDAEKRNPRGWHESQRYGEEGREKSLGAAVGRGEPRRARWKWR